MKPIEQWLSEYQKDHKHPTNLILHKICVPVIVFSLLGLLFCIPFPFSASSAPDRLYMNWAIVLVFFAMLFYLRVVPRFTLLLLSLIFTILATLVYWEIRSPETVLSLNLGLFTLAWAGQLIGHHIEGRKPSFFKDIQFLLIGPIWVLVSVLKFKPKP